MGKRLFLTDKLLLMRNIHISVERADSLLFERHGEVQKGKVSKILDRDRQ